INDMRNKLPILLVLILLAVVAVAPLLRRRGNWCRYIPFSQETTVPPPTAINLPPNSPLPMGDEKGVRDRPPGEGHGVRAAGNDAATASSSPARANAQTLIDYAVLAVEGQQFISAQVSEEGELLGHPFAGLGHYCEHRQGPIPQMQFSM